ncbi:hypothetical protein CRG98_018019 [Punica granatum]|uniref:Uncharacterized protein n=1 Tax=Punica granatum TaxID=22663 RepID=A0A2I0K0F3_PUNGR|nr:hypothetical protein CRG98_018019 [Punica granatum]
MSSVASFPYCFPIRSPPPLFQMPQQRVLAFPLSLPPPTSQCPREVPTPSGVRMDGSAMVLETPTCPKVVSSKPFFLSLDLFYTVGRISACISCSKVVIYFTHVIMHAEESQ